MLFYRHNVKLLVYGRNPRLITMVSTSDPLNQSIYKCDQLFLVNSDWYYLVLSHVKMKGF